MAKAKSKQDVSQEPVRVLEPHEYPAQITTPRGALTPRVLLAIEHPLGLYHVDDEGANPSDRYLAVYFLPRRAKHDKRIGATRDLRASLVRIARHEDEMLHPDAPRQMGRHGPVRIQTLSQRLPEAGEKPDSVLDREIRAILAAHQDFDPTGRYAR